MLQMKFVSSLCGTILFVYISILIYFVINNNISKKLDVKNTTIRIDIPILSDSFSNQSLYFCQHSISELNQYIWSHKAISDILPINRNFNPNPNPDPNHVRINQSKQSLISLLEHNIFKYDIDIVAVAIVTKSIIHKIDRKNSNDQYSIIHNYSYGCLITCDSEYNHIQSIIDAQSLNIEDSKPSMNSGANIDISFFPSPATSKMYPNSHITNTNSIKEIFRYQLEVVYIVSHPMAIYSTPFNASCQSGSCWWEAYPTLELFLSMVDNGVMKTKTMTTSKAVVVDAFISIEPKFEVTTFLSSGSKTSSVTSMLVKGVVQLLSRLPLKCLKGRMGLIVSTKEDRETLQSISTFGSNPQMIRIVYAYKNPLFMKPKVVPVLPIQAPDLGTSGSLSLPWSRMKRPWESNKHDKIDLVWDKHSEYAREGSDLAAPKPLHMPESALLLRSMNAKGMNHININTNAPIVCWIVDDEFIMRQLLLHHPGSESRSGSASNSIHGFITNKPIELLRLIRTLYRQTC